MMRRTLLPRRCARRRPFGVGVALPALVVACRSSGPAALDAEDLALRLLRQRPLAPLDVSLFDPSAYPGAPPSVPAADTAPAVMAEATEAELQRVLAARQSPEAALTRGLATWSSEMARLWVVLAALAGTLGEPASAFLLESGDWERVVVQARGLEGLAEIAARRGEPSVARRCCERASALFERHGAVFSLNPVRMRWEALAP